MTDLEIVLNAEALLLQSDRFASFSTIVKRLADRSRIDLYEFAKCLALSGVDRVGPFLFFRLPNDKAVIEAIRTDNDAARADFDRLLHKHTISGVASVLRCSDVWVMAAIARWRIFVPDEKREGGNPENEELLEKTHNPREIKLLISNALHQYRWQNEAAWSMGVGWPWFQKKKNDLGTYTRRVKTIGEGTGQHLGKLPPEKVSQATKDAILKRLVAIGSVHEWAAEVGISRPEARRQARLLGYTKSLERGSKDWVRCTLAGWLMSQQDYSPVSTSWIKSNVLCCDLKDQNISAYIVAIMKELGYYSEKLPDGSAFVWHKGFGNAKKSEVVLVDDPSNKLGPLDATPTAMAERQRLRTGLLSGTINPTVEMLKKAGLQYGHKDS